MIIQEERSLAINMGYNVKSRLQNIIYDGWKYGFEPAQTVEEAAILGYTIDVQTVEKCWARFSSRSKI